MSTTNASELLRPALLEGCSILIAGAQQMGRAGTLGGSAGAACAGLGASVTSCELDAAEVLGLDDAAAEQLVGRALAGGELDLLVIDAASLYAAAAPSASDVHNSVSLYDALRVSLDASWNITRAVANLAFLPEQHGGRIAYLAPAGDAGECAQAALAGLENLARTLSIEWARHQITTVTVAPGAHAAAADEAAALIAYLASPAGAYFSGCLFDLRGSG